MAAHPDVIILGGGVIGLTTAYYLAAEGVSVSVLDRGDLGRQASWAGAGIVPPGNIAAVRSPLDRLRAVSAALFPSLSEQLREETGIDNGYVVCGGIELIGDPAPSPDAWREEGIAFEAIDNAGLRRIEPALSPGVGNGFYLPGMAQLRNPRHLKALIAACEERAVGLLPGCGAFGFQRNGERITAVDTEQGRLVAERFLVATGAWSDELFAPLGWRPGIAPVRGQMALLNTRQAGVRPVVLEGKRYLVPRTDGLMLVGATEENAGFDARPTAGGIAGLLEFAERLVPGLADATLERCWAGLRPASRDGLPFLGAVPGYSNLFVSAGHFRAGIQLSPATGQVMTDLLVGRPTVVPIAPFLPGRPPAPPGQTAFRS
jgi:glycine oxidase